ncbi:GDSL-type esterase/lipase family protein [Clavibacter michiganensis]|uniref:GDSL-type esterase/lipase family protein n=1 Tax=Clavibacter michiganensis TaxID=28447 RepID=UPI001D0B23F9|nr:GDSL-type esterase/lipase family protein [Clavibacter michiganensis]MDO4044556.1 SGNH/GDSL hydrolase family protein [Clavibacter michiganensis]MDO4054326.1 SGNH/GDSL hydrolase family protein [Clavibacter michiganensis]MDO4056868.1 SGNH/GDSL hydrolase family protein [Clavibacter michiganensis]MDO4070242.1 SGNH/GDSL hydrolase family protein [Clavibacter michiganensis]UDM14320.1 GDSL-type esterase/lipase family protein [Clavibacter michiganensis subsp. michiganensis]
MSGIGASAGDGAVVELDGGSVRVHGHLGLMAVPGGVRPIRLPEARWRDFPPAGELLRAQVSTAAGVRIRFTTRAAEVRLRVRCTRIRFDELPGPRNTFVAEVDGVDLPPVAAPVDVVRRIPPSGDAAEETAVGSGDPPVVVLRGLGHGPSTVTVWLPQGMLVDLVGVTAEEPVRAADPLGLPRWIHHGSSISHCVEAPDPTGAWPVVAARQAGLDLVGLGFGGQCMLDPFVADAIADEPADVISLSVGINIVGARSMDQRTFVPALHGFLDRVRRGHPDTPIVLASSILWPGSEHVPGPPGVEFRDDGSVRCFAAGDPADVPRGALTLAESRRHVAHVARVRWEAGERIAHLDGLALYGPDDVERYALPDGLHPDAELYAEMGRRWVARVFADGGLVPRGGLRAGGRSAAGRP